MIEKKDPEKEVSRLLKELHASIPSRFHPALSELRHQISRISTGINVLKEWKHEPAEEIDWLRYGLTMFEADLMTALRQAGPTGLSKERAMALQYANQIDDWPELKILDVRVHHIREKLAAHRAPWWIETIHSRGWILHAGHHEPRLSSCGDKMWSKPTFKPNRRSDRHTKAATLGQKSEQKLHPAK